MGGVGAGPDPIGRANPGPNNNCNEINQLHAGGYAENVKNSNRFRPKGTKPSYLIEI
jgi:hypothetical protein